jgi:hypothetical protein
MSSVHTIPPEDGVNPRPLPFQGKIPADKDGRHPFRDVTGMTLADEVIDDDGVDVGLSTHFVLHLGYNVI